jgi:hypothetical protein
MSWLRHFDNKFRLLIPWGLQKWHGYAVWVGGYAVWGVATPFGVWLRRFLDGIVKDVFFVVVYLKFVEELEVFVAEGLFLVVGFLVLDIPENDIDL